METDTNRSMGGHGYLRLDTLRVCGILEVVCPFLLLIGVLPRFLRNRIRNYELFIQSESFNKFIVSWVVILPRIVYEGIMTLFFNSI